MFEVLWLGFELVAAFPWAALGALWYVAARYARGMKMQGWPLGPFALLLAMYQQRRNLAGLLAVAAGTMLGVMWAGALMMSPEYRWSMGGALPIAAAVWLLLTLMHRYPQLSVSSAAVAWWHTRRHTDDLRPAVRAAVGEQARVVRDSVRVTDDGTVEADVIGPPGMSHADLVGGLRESLAESVLAVSGRALKDVAVTGTAVKGRVRVRCSTKDPYGETLRWPG